MSNARLVKENRLPQIMLARNKDNVDAMDVGSIRMQSFSLGVSFSRVNE